MSTPINNGGPAFPVPSFVGPNGDLCNTGQYWDGNGMTLRDYYRGKILAGFCANPAVFQANGMSGWGLVNCKDSDLVAYADHLAGLACQIKEGALQP